MRIQFVKSATEPEHWPQPVRPEVALAGRSNAGKSSFLNALAGSKVAKVSGTPGKTRLLNFFDAGEFYRFVDMPGYGYAARSGGERHNWQPMIERFLTERDVLVGLLLIMDIRREWSEDESLLKYWTDRQNVPLALVLTKSDKLSRGAAFSRKRKLQKDSGVNNVFIVSSLKRDGLKDVEQFVFESWIRSVDEFDAEEELER